MITKEQLLEAVIEYIQVMDDDEGNFDLNPETELALESRISETFGHDDWQSILEDLDVEDVAERLEWYNTSVLDIDDALKIANVNFGVLTCRMCNQVGYKGPDSEEFPMTYDPAYPEGVHQLDIEIGGKTGEIVLCGGCLNKIWVMMR